MTCCVPRGLPSAVPVQWVAAILAGCDGRRDLRIVSETLGLLTPQVPIVIVSTDGDPRGLQGCDVPVVASEAAGSAGMLLAALDWAKENAWEIPWVATVPAGWDQVPPDLIARLAAAVTGSGAQAACVADAGRLVLELGLWPVNLRRELRRFVASGEEGKERSLFEWVRGLALAVVDLRSLCSPAPSPAPLGAPAEGPHPPHPR